MGHNEPCRAQLAIWSNVVSAYCIAPDFFSCDGKGTSRLALPVTGSLSDVPGGVAGTGSSCEAEWAGEDEMERLELVGLDGDDDDVVVAIAGRARWTVIRGIIEDAAEFSSAEGWRSGGSSLKLQAV